VLACLGTGGFFVYQYSGNQNTTAFNNSTNTHVQPKTAKASDNNNVKKGQLSSDEQKIINNDAVQSDGAPEIQNEKQYGETIMNKEEKKNNSKNAEKNNDKSATLSGKQITRIDRTTGIRNNTRNIVPVNEANNMVPVYETRNKAENNLTAVSENVTLNKNKFIIPFADLNARADVKAPATIVSPVLKTSGLQNATAALIPKTKKPADKKWSFAVTASAGVATVVEGNMLNFDKSMVEDVSFTPNFAPTPAPAYTPSSISPDFTYSAGLAAKYKLSKRFSLSAGVNYTQMNTRSKVGQQVNSSQVVNNGTRGYLYVASYYLVDYEHKSEYRNRYHFLEFPVSLHTRINRSEKLPVYWNAGVIVSRLLRSNSLHFDGTTGVYYKNDRLLNQTQAAVSTGFSFAVFNKRPTPVWIGPSLRYNISPILQKDLSANKHFATLGLDIKIFLK
jgi:hypothetical protein